MITVGMILLALFHKEVTAGDGLKSKPVADAVSEDTGSVRD